VSPSIRRAMWLMTLLITPARATTSRALPAKPPESGNSPRTRSPIASGWCTLTFLAQEQLRTRRARGPEDFALPLRWSGSGAQGGAKRGTPCAEACAPAAHLKARAARPLRQTRLPGWRDRGGSAVGLSGATTAAARCVRAARPSQRRDVTTTASACSPLRTVPRHASP
jgi:hypothetical protein